MSFHPDFENFSFLYIILIFLLHSQTALITYYIRSGASKPNKSIPVSSTDFAR